MWSRGAAFCLTEQVQHNPQMGRRDQAQNWRRCQVVARTRDFSFSAYETRTNIAIARLTALIDNIKTQLDNGANGGLINVFKSVDYRTHASTKAPKVNFHWSLHRVGILQWPLPNSRGLKQYLLDSERISYLKACIKGDATKIISSLEFTNTNYPIAWQLLTTREV